MVIFLDENIRKFIEWSVNERRFVLIGVKEKNDFVRGFCEDMDEEFLTLHSLEGEVIKIPTTEINDCASPVDQSIEALTRKLEN